MNRYLVCADPTEIEATLQDRLTPQELASLRIESLPKPSRSPFAPGPRRADPTGTTVVVWIVGAVASGITYDLLKALSIKVFKILQAKYGEVEIEEDDSID